MSARSHISVTTKLQAMCLVARCSICGEHLGPLDGLEWDHKQALALGGTNSPDNLNPLHKACHRLKTSGSKATSYGSDIHAIAKTKRLANGPKKHKGRKLQSRGFDKSHKTKFTGPAMVSKP